MKKMERNRQYVNIVNFNTDLLKKIMFKSLGLVGSLASKPKVESFLRDVFQAYGQLQRKILADRHTRVNRRGKKGWAFQINNDNRVNVTSKSVFIHVLDLESVEVNFKHGTLDLRLDVGMGGRHEPLMLRYSRRKDKLIVFTYDHKAFWTKELGWHNSDKTPITGRAKRFFIQLLSSKVDVSKTNLQPSQKQALRNIQQKDQLMSSIFHKSCSQLSPETVNRIIEIYLKLVTTRPSQRDMSSLAQQLRTTTHEKRCEFMKTIWKAYIHIRRMLLEKMKRKESGTCKNEFMMFNLEDVAKNPASVVVVRSEGRPPVLHCFEIFEAEQMLKKTPKHPFMNTPWTENQKRSMNLQIELYHAVNSLVVPLIRKVVPHSTYALTVQLYDDISKAVRAINPYTGQMDRPGHMDTTPFLKIVGEKEMTEEEKKSPWQPQSVEQLGRGLHMAVEEHQFPEDATKWKLFEQNPSVHNFVQWFSSSLREQPDLRHRAELVGLFYQLVRGDPNLQFVWTPFEQNRWKRIRFG